MRPPRRIHGARRFAFVRTCLLQLLLMSMCGAEQTPFEPGSILASRHGHSRPVHSKELNMNKDQVNGKLQDIGGKIQEEAGKLVGSTEQQAKGLANQVEGKTQEKVGDLKEAVKDATN
jgi:uncharacterized protein YjbJ (UPF0337 family)